MVQSGGDVKFFKEGKDMDETEKWITPDIDELNLSCEITSYANADLGLSEN